EVTEEIMEGQATPSQIGAFLTALRIKGESVDEITGMARTMRAKSLRVEVNGDVLDVVSTGGGSFDPLNISTAAALVCAACGVLVAKHGNRGFTSASGAADVLEALGAKLELEPAQVKQCIEETGFGFMFAQTFHPAMRHAGPTRREIGIRTIFNSLGPLTNPAGARYQLIGAGTGELADKMAQVVARLGTAKTLIVHSGDGLDEVSAGAPTSVREIVGSTVSTSVIMPEDAGIERTPLDAIKTGSAAENAARIKAVFEGARGADRDYIVLNAGTALLAANRVQTVREGATNAAQAIDSGEALKRLERFVSVSRRLGGAS
ncbi:MAG TPA: anthranilate phosphoribosyltransferase, partial [Polyangia bacterium]